MQADSNHIYANDVTRVITPLARLLLAATSGASKTISLAQDVIYGMQEISIQGASPSCDSNGDHCKVWAPAMHSVG